ncbi:methyl-accepting chemotaxis protein [Treponema pedis]
MKKRFTIRLKLLIVFGLLIITSILTLGLLTLQISKKALTEKVELYLSEKAKDTAEIIDGKITSLVQFLQGMARMKILLNADMTYKEKIAVLNKEASLNKDINKLEIADINGYYYTSEGYTAFAGNFTWFQSAKAGKPYISEPLVSEPDKNVIMIVSVPVYDDNHNIMSVLAATISGFWLSDIIKDITVGESGECSMFDAKGIIIADRNMDLVTARYNLIEEAKQNPEFVSIAAFLESILTKDAHSVGYYDYGGLIIVGYAKLSNNWRIIIGSAVSDVMSAISVLRNSIYILGLFILLLTLVIVFIVAHILVKPIIGAVNALNDIAHGEGDLTVQLPVSGNDEITDLSRYFNQTIEKIGKAIHEVSTNADIMKNIGEELASNMTETAGAVHQISANIEGVKHQALTQAASVTETVSTIEEIIQTIRQLNTNIEKQTLSVAKSSSAIEQMVANISSITQILEKTNDVIKNLSNATEDGKQTIATSNSVTQKIAEESGGLLEASSVIQHIASQTNLLAMNAAIEAAHAGEAGKGFAVVADEIRKLAEESSMQGKTITSTLKTLSGEIEILSGSAKTAEEKFNAIFGLSDEVKSMSSRLMEAMKEQENGSKEVLTAIEDINAITAQVNAGSAEMLIGGENVAKEMQKLDGLTRSITDSMNEMAAGAIQINNAVQEVNEITQKNKISIENLVKEVNRFKV